MIIVVSIFQLRFSQHKAGRNLLWVLTIVVALIFVIQITFRDFYQERRRLLDIVFWVAMAGVGVTYIWLKKFKK